MFLDDRSKLGELAEPLSKPVSLLENMTLLVENWDQQDLELPPEFFNGFLSAVRTFPSAASFCLLSRAGFPNSPRLL